jgi:hypothetical protein
MCQVMVLWEMDSSTIGASSVLGGPGLRFPHEEEPAGSVQVKEHSVTLTGKTSEGCACLLCGVHSLSATGSVVDAFLFALSFGQRADCCLAVNIDMTCMRHERSWNDRSGVFGSLGGHSQQCALQPRIVNGRERSLLCCLALCILCSIFQLACSNGYVLVACHAVPCNTF